MNFAAPQPREISEALPDVLLYGTTRILLQPAPKIDPLPKCLQSSTFNELHPMQAEAHHSNCNSHTAATGYKKWPNTNRLLLLSFIDYTYHHVAKILIFTCVFLFIHFQWIILVRLNLFYSSKTWACSGSHNLLHSHRSYIYTDSSHLNMLTSSQCSVNVYFVSHGKSFLRRQKSRQIIKIILSHLHI